MMRVYAIRCVSFVLFTLYYNTCLYVPIFISFYMQAFYLFCDLEDDSLSGRPSITTDKPVERGRSFPKGLSPRQKEWRSIIVAQCIVGPQRRPRVAPRFLKPKHNSLAFYSRHGRGSSATEIGRANQDLPGSIWRLCVSDSRAE